MIAPPDDLIFEQTLKQGSKEFGVNLTHDQISGMIRHMRLLKEWGARVNLTSLRKSRDIALLHFLDSLSVFSVIPFGDELAVLDVGAGAGFPGMVIRIADPAKRVTLLDRNPKRIVFLKHVAHALSLADVRYLDCDVRRYLSDPRGVTFDVVVSRAFSSDLDFLDALSGLVADAGRLVRMSGPNSGKVESPPVGFRVSALWEGTLPGSRVRRKVVAFQRNT